MQFKFDFDVFIPGQRVKFISKYNYRIGYGETGTIVRHPWGMMTTENVAVDWDKKETERHDCAGAARNGHGWCVSKRDIEIIF